MLNEALVASSRTLGFVILMNAVVKVICFLNEVEECDTLFKKVEQISREDHQAIT